MLRWAILGTGLAVIGILAVMDGEGASPGEEAPRPAPGYALFEHDSGALSVGVPAERDERVVVDAEGEKASWSAFLGDSESIGPSLTAVSDLNSWRTGTPGGICTYSGVIQEWENYGGDSEYTATVLAAAPEGRECVVALRIEGYLQVEEEGIRHVLVHSGHRGL